ncbi:hypothetical protein [Paraburkholderia caballeronis]|uniref:Lipoprotein n=1 Tax=Paraburkholderia caballeronis TaxID=416943 RepID=A0A1H7U090_9BURK|nr:hypothetical protein [Paraburkholderia caballeronis]PXW23427.1 hypothetical protein C7403_110165 [Paraburkholderia caballeronis]PXW98420.1 hypothetical protein C7407_110165 [Paraburkholderia caballeronis]RAJ95151.1 hypothetical protein C7409_110166 [Paraburkholderia caballeronis]SEC53990.1 hypothetical protein SAMN05445871_2395 [Paraburkholderia caballeronis]SEL90199.1 hypothetical protein SAMN05192542_11755 [Paraburkholderia caballeronis]
MKKLMLLAAGVVLFALSVAGCTTAQQQDLATLAAQAQTNVIKACAVVQPVLLDLSASIPADPNLALLATDNGKLCAAVATLDPTNVQSLVNTVIPQAIGLVSLLPIDAGTQTTIRLALGAASIALSNWLAVYGTPSTSTAPASAPAAASAPVAASS